MFNLYLHVYIHIIIAIASVLIYLWHSKRLNSWLCLMFVQCLCSRLAYGLCMLLWMKKGIYLSVKYQLIKKIRGLAIQSLYLSNGAILASLSSCIMVPRPSYITFLCIRM